MKSGGESHSLEEGPKPVSQRDIRTPVVSFSLFETPWSVTGPRHRWKRVVSPRKGPENIFKNSLRRWFPSILSQGFTFILKVLPGVRFGMSDGVSFMQEGGVDPSRTMYFRVFGLPLRRRRRED